MNTRRCILALATAALAVNTPAAGAQRLAPVAVTRQLQQSQSDSASTKTPAYIEIPRDVAIGGGLGAVSGLLIAFGLVHIDNYPDHSEDVIVYYVVGLLGAGVGAIIGLIAGIFNSIKT